MAEQTGPQRIAGAGEYMREENSPVTGILKADLRAAYDALDTFMNNNAGAINSALPLPFRTSATTQQKARLLMLVIRHRYLNGA